METVHVRAAHLDHPDDAERIYQSSKFMHRLSGLIMGLAYKPKEFHGNSAHALKR